MLRVAGAQVAAVRQVTIRQAAAVLVAAAVVVEYSLEAVVAQVGLVTL
jgi:hypothetical protein